jgi:hypothetical protein
MHSDNKPPEQQRVVLNERHRGQRTTPAAARIATPS